MQDDSHAIQKLMMMTVSRHKNIYEIGSSSSFHSSKNKIHTHKKDCSISLHMRQQQIFLKYSFIYMRDQALFSYMFRFRETDK